MVNFIALIILHILGDFYLQTNKIAKCKNAKIDDECAGCMKCKQTSVINRKYLLLHAFLYSIPFFFLFFITDWLPAIIIYAIVSVSHCIIDVLSCYENKKFKKTIVFLFDQFLHISIIYLLYKLFAFNSILIGYELAIKITFVTLLLISPSSILVNKLFEDVFSKKEEIKIGDKKEESNGTEPVSANQNVIFDVGSIIGILERILVLIFSCFGDFAAIAIIITVKTWARTGDLKTPEFRNKYLLGTLASIVIALLAFLLYNSL